MGGEYIIDTQNAILVVCDPMVNYYEELNNQLLGKARSLSKENAAQVLCIHWGRNQKDAVELLCYGAHKVIQCGYEAEDYTIYSKAVKLIIDNYKPNLVMFTGTGLGKAIAATVATLLGAGLVADCIDIQPMEGNRYMFSRAALSSSIIANIICTKDCLQMCTVKPNIFISYVKQFDFEKEEVEEFHCEIRSDYADRIHLVGTKDNDTVEDCKLEKSKIIFAVGRGVSDEDFKGIQKLANHYGADIGGTRIMVEKGKIPKARQIGQSGVNVAPDLYIAFGISGANQHIAGIQNAKNVIAINNDEKAAIFDYSDYGMVSDVHDVVRKFVNKVNGGTV